MSLAKLTPKIRYDYSNADSAGLQQNPWHQLQEYAEKCRKKAREIVDIVEEVNDLQKSVESYTERLKSQKSCVSRRNLELEEAEREEATLREELEKETAQSCELNAELEEELGVSEMLIDERNKLTAELNQLLLTTEEIATAEAVTEAKAAKYSQMMSNDDIMHTLKVDILAYTGLLQTLGSSVRE